MTMHGSKLIITSEQVRLACECGCEIAIRETTESTLGDRVVPKLDCPGCSASYEVKTDGRPGFFILVRRVR